MEPKDQERFLDEWLERALKQRGKAEARPGLENRILASIRAERERVPMRTWAWRPVWVSLAAILLMGVIVSLRRTPDRAAPRSVASVVVSPVVSNSPEHSVAAVVQKPRAHSIRRSTPRQEQFPSPQPLSEQEEILARYIEQFPREAVLVAQAQTQLSKQEMIEQETFEQNR
ncbi:MAG TPA: hypothetical protein VEF05_19350 [Terriglobales bacterium]|nr:hypothetical protein [Terriglobales bacterium]